MLVSGSNKEWKLKHNAHQLFTRKATANRRRREIELLLMGGYPPHLASMRSMAPWLRAQLAAKHIQAQEEKQNSFFQMAHDKFFED